MARCGCADTGANSVRSMLSAQDGVKYNSLTGVFSADISLQPGNNLTLDAFGRLFVPTGAATVSVGPGILGNGSGGNPVRANVASWPYVTTPVTGAEGVFVDPSTGQLKSPPAQIADFVSTLFDRSYSNIAAGTGGTPTTADTFTVTLTNPDPNRSCIVIISREVKVRFTMPAGSSVGYAIAADETARFHNPGTASISNVGVQTAKSFKSANLGPGGVSSYSLTVGTENAVGAVTYNRIEVAIRVLYIAQG